MYEVFLCYCPAHFPFIFARHTWLVIKENGNFSKYEVLFEKNTDAQKGYIHVSTKKVFEGIQVLPGRSQFVWKWNILGSIQWKEAIKITEIIKKSIKDYPHRNTYKITGPNSNSYIQWILNKCPEWKIKLPWNAFGK